MRKVTVRRVLYLGWLGHANVGDDVLFEIFKRGILEYVADNALPIVVDVEAWQSHKGYEQSVHQYDLVVLGGGSIFHIGHWLTICLEARKHGAKIVAWGTGVDALSKSQISLLPPATRQMVADVLSGMDYISCRGPYTKSWLLEYYTGANVHEIGDPALNYVPLNRERVANGGVTNSALKRTNTIYVNWGSSANQIFGGNELALEAELVEALKLLVQDGFKIVIIPIWVADREHCQRLADKIAHSSVQLIPNVLAADRLFGVLQQCKMAISLKLHGAILAAAAGCLPVSLAYRFKCIEFMHSIGMDEYCLPTDEVDASAIVSTVTRLDSERLKYGELIHKKKNSYAPALRESYAKICAVLDHSHK